MLKLLSDLETYGYWLHHTKFNDMCELFSTQLRTQKYKNKYDFFIYSHPCINLHITILFLVMWVTDGPLVIQINEFLVKIERKMLPVYSHEK